MAGLLDWQDDEQRAAQQRALMSYAGDVARQQDRQAVFDALGQTLPAQLIKSIYQSARLPGDVYQGKVDPRSDEAINRAADFAGAAITGSMPFAVRGALGSGGGKMVQPDDVAPKAKGRKGKESLEPKSDDEALAVLHNTKLYKLEKADKLGGLPVPSLAITKPAQGYTSFGDVTLVGPPQMAQPSKQNPIFASDAYTPRFPSLNDEGTMIFRGFTPSGNRRYAPLTMENVVREMKGNLRGGENWNYGAGSVRSGVTPEFKSIDEIKASRGRIVTPDEFRPLADQANDQLYELSKKFHPYSKYSGNLSQHADDFGLMLKEMGTRGERAVTEHYKDLPPELMKEARAYLNFLRDMPTAYFEAKPQRGVQFSEFAGAVVPKSQMEDAARLLEPRGVTRFEQYNDRDEADRIRALMAFRDMMFSNAPAGLLGAGAVAAGAAAQRPVKREDIERGLL